MKWGVPEMGVPPVIIDSFFGFSLTKTTHNLGVSTPCRETSRWNPICMFACLVFKYAQHPPIRQLPDFIDLRDFRHAYWLSDVGSSILVVNRPNCIIGLVLLGFSGGKPLGFHAENHAIFHGIVKTHGFPVHFPNQ